MGALVIVALALAQATPNPAGAAAPSAQSLQPADELRRAINEYAYGNYTAAIQELRGLLYPMRLVSDAQVIDARKYLALCYYLTGKLEQMREEFEKLLYLDPDHQLDAFSIPPSIIESFEALRLAKKPELDAIRQRRVDASLEVRASPGLVRVMESTTVEKSELGTFLPFGVGQFQNGQTAWGVFFAAAEAVFLAANIGSFLVLQFGVGDDFPPEDRGTVNALTVAQYAGLRLFGVTWGLGVLHARLNFVPSVSAPPVVRDEPLNPKAALAPGLSFSLPF